MSTRRKLFYGATLVIVAALLLTPSTGWLARLQLLPWTQPGMAQIMMPRNDAARRAAWEARYQKTLAANPRETFAFRFAHAFVTDYSDAGNAESLRRLESLHADYSNNAPVIAQLLNLNGAKAVRVSRPEQDMLTSAERAERKVKPRKKELSDPATVARFVALAKQGEMLEPRNAFFSTMVAMGEFARKNDDAAVAAWIRAGRKNAWDGHDTEPVEARWRLDRAMNHGAEPGTIYRMNTMAQARFPMYAVLRASARMATYCAWQRELRGDKEGGFVLRQASRRIGQTLQNTSKSFIGNLVGGAMVRIATGKFPGSDELKKTLDQMKGEHNSVSKRRDAAKVSAYAAHLRRIGKADEATAFLQAVAETDRLKTVWRRANPETYWGFESKTGRFVAAWAACLLLLAGALFSLVFAGIFKTVYRFSPRLQKGEPLQASARWGVTAGLILPVLAAAIALSAIGLWLEPDAAVLTGFAVAVATVAVPPFVLRLGGRGFAHGLLVMMATWVSVAVLIGAGYLCFASARNVTETFDVMRTGYNTEDAAWGAAVQAATPWIIGLTVLSVPLGLLALFGVFSKILRVPFAAGVTRGMRAMAVPLAAVLMLGWAGAFLVTLRHENAAIREMEAMNRVGEIQYLKTVAATLPSAKDENE